MLASIFSLELCILACQVTSVLGTPFHEDGKVKKVFNAKSLITEKAVIVAWKPVGAMAPNSTFREFREGPSLNTPAMEIHDGPPRNFIVNGEKASRREQQFVVTIQIYHEGKWWHVCGGAIVTPNKIITAAHCMRWWGYDDNAAATDYRVGCGWYDLSYGLLNPGSQTYSVVKSIRHPRYNYYGPDRDSGIQPYDLAVLTLSGNLEFDERVRPVTIAGARDSFADEECDIVGWGDTENGYPNILHKSQMTVMGQSLCKQFWRIGKARIYNVEMCTWDWPTRLSSTCSGDSGGPLVCRGKLAGIVAWGLTYCNGCFPSVNTRVSSFTSWIEEQVGESLS